jgi:hypothetical protein
VLFGNLQRDGKQAGTGFSKDHGLRSLLETVRDNCD